MNGTLESIEHAARGLAVHERAQLAHSLLKGLDESDADEPAIESLWATEAEDRLDAYQNGEIVSSPLDEVIDRVRSRIGE
ncbi:MAG: addiction module protein [Chloracidobacterium sp.]|nr:addiction module protein [Chloracidobacterium sp.]